jgi:hypothetical protein
MRGGNGKVQTLSGLEDGCVHFSLCVVCILFSLERKTKLGEQIFLFVPNKQTSIFLRTNIWIQKTRNIFGLTQPSGKWKKTYRGKNHQDFRLPASLWVAFVKLVIRDTPV